MRDSFIFYRSFYEAIKDLPQKDFNECIRAICEYGLNGQIVEVNGKMSKVAMTLILPQLEANIKRYANGSKGGRPKKTNGFENKKPMVSKTKTNGYETKKPNKNVNENDNENVNVNDNGGSRGKYDPTNNPQISDIEISNLLKEMNRA